MPCSILDETVVLSYNNKKNNNNNNLKDCDLDETTRQQWITITILQHGRKHSLDDMLKRVKHKFFCKGIKK
jgi:hypothetical protein